MIGRLKELLAGEPEGAVIDDDGDVRLAAAALLVEAAVMDGVFDSDERRTIVSLLIDAFDLDSDAADALVDSAEAEVEASGQLYAFTRVVKERFDHDQRVNMIEMLWEVAYADGRLHDFEASLVRRVAGLIHVPDRESGMARKRVLARAAPA